jgi:hypothetical protein
MKLQSNNDLIVERATPVRRFLQGHAGSFAAQSPTCAFKGILIDDDVAQKIISERIFKSLTDLPFRLDHVTRCSQAITRAFILSDGRQCA